jgi:hypothetical protein
LSRIQKNLVLSLPSWQRVVETVSVSPTWKQLALNLNSMLTQGDLLNAFWCKIKNKNIYPFHRHFSEFFYALAWGVSLSHSAFQLLAVGGNCNKIYFISTNDLLVEVTQDIATIAVKKGKKGKVSTGINSLCFHPTQLDILICKKFH